MSYLIVALGNPGKEYEKTRHNVGFIFLKEILQKNNFESLAFDKYCEGFLAHGLLFDEKVAALFPETFMNESGRSVKKFLQEGDSVENLIVVHDDIDLELGVVKIAKSRGAGGHNGVRSLIKYLETKDFIRVRIGIALPVWENKRPTGEALSDFVLGNFSKKEREILEEKLEQVEKALFLIMKEGVSKAMEVINRA